MHITDLRISNFKAITSIHLAALQEMVVIAGPNGCGKSCIFDAIRLLKSAYGGYAPNEMQNWFGEFQLNVNQIENQLARLLQRADEPLEIAATFSFSDNELQYLRDHAADLLRDQIWREEAPTQSGMFRRGEEHPLAANLRIHQPRVEERLRQELTSILEGLRQRDHVARITFVRGHRPTAAPARVLELVFRTYDPENIGIIDYHSANRNYAREQLGGINLNIEAESDRLRQHALYNSAGKYNNLKSEMAGLYVRQLLAKEAGVEILGDDLNATLRNL